MEANRRSVGDQFRFKDRKQEQAAYHPEEGQEGMRCPACHTLTKPGADICEACHHWLLEGQCCFCYAPFRAGQKFCSSCGNPPAGITCKSCGTASHFDFCPKCDTPLSKKAGPSLQVLLDSPEVQALMHLQEQLAQQPASPQPTVNNVPDLQEELRQLNAYLKQAGSNDKKDQQPGKPSFLFTGDNKDFSQEMADSQASMDKINQENQVVDLNAVKEQIRQLQEKAFSDNQSARLYYMSIKMIMPQLRVNVCTGFVGWQCNYAKVIHTPGPADCACPSMGGRWICNNDVNWKENEIAFEYDGQLFTPGEENKLVTNP